MKVRPLRKLGQTETSQLQQFNYLYRELGSFIDDLNNGMQKNLSFDDNLSGQINIIDASCLNDSIIPNTLSIVPNRLIDLRGSNVLIKGSIWDKSNVSIRLDKAVYGLLKVPAASVDTGNDLINYTNHPYVDGDRIVFSTDNTLPSGLELNKIYLLYQVGRDTFSLLDDSTKSKINLTTQGSGNHYISIVRNVEVMFF
jgi:hypothetical protein